MSDRAIRDEDADVLASIRRLVADAPGGVRAAERAAQIHQDEAEEPREKLLLTPALRVAPAEPDPPGTAVTEPPRTASPVPKPAVRVDVSSWSLEDRIAELESVIGTRPDEWEPDGSEDADQETPRRFVFQHRPLPLAGREVDRNAPALRLAEAVSPEHLEFDLTEDAVLTDEDALRDLVAEIVREELQGELGQRVTRNIRKLVRREVRRALMSRDFD